MFFGVKLLVEANTFVVDTSWFPRAVLSFLMVVNGFRLECFGSMVHLIVIFCESNYV